MRRFLAPLIGIPLGLAIAVAASLLAPEVPRAGAAQVDALLRPALAPGAAPLPRVGILPPDPLRPPPGITAQANGTGFFAAPGTVLTAAHVVSECREIRILSRFLPVSVARIASANAEHDIAVLSTEAVAPALLGLGGRVPGRVLVYGYPAEAGREVPSSTWASLANARIEGTSSLETDPRTLLWLQAGAIAQGYSGGPVIDPADGSVVGIVRALIDPARAVAAYGIATPDLSIGPGTTPLRAMLGAATASLDESDDIFTRAHKATVRVICWQ